MARHGVSTNELKKTFIYDYIQICTRKEKSVFRFISGRQSISISPPQTREKEKSLVTNDNKIEASNDTKMTNDK